jgi:electron transport complex protein RnfB
MPDTDTARESLAEQINRLLPQTQCRQCDFAGCRPYAEAIAEGKADINQCPPGGDAGIRALAVLLGVDTKPLNIEHGVHKPDSTVIIREAECIGCTKCIQACPVDAIIGASKMMHTVLADLCTGCNLCIPPCPVDCIDTVAVAIPT